jgi:hypothetical protein
MAPPRLWEMGSELAAGFSLRRGALRRLVVLPAPEAFIASPMTFASWLRISQGLFRCSNDTCLPIACSAKSGDASSQVIPKPPG